MHNSLESKGKVKKKKIPPILLLLFLLQKETASVQTSHGLQEADPAGPRAAGKAHFHGSDGRSSKINDEKKRN